MSEQSDTHDQEKEIYACPSRASVLDRARSEMKYNYKSEIGNVDHQSVLGACDALYNDGLTHSNVSSVMRDFDLDPDDCELSDVMVAVRKILGRILGEHLEYDAYATALGRTK